MAYLVWKTKTSNALVTPVFGHTDWKESFSRIV